MTSFRSCYGVCVYVRVCVLVCMCVSLCMNFQVNKSSSDFWNNLKLTWQQCADLPDKCCSTSVAELDGKVYVSGESSETAFFNPFMYDSDKDQWSTLPELPCWYFSLVTVTEKKQLLAIGGRTSNNGVIEESNKVFLWDEKYKKWLTPYPKMPTARCSTTSISHGLTVIVAGGITNDPDTITRAVEVLHINDNNLHDSYWSVVEQLPLVVYEAIPLIVNDKLYIAVGADTFGGSTTCNVVTVSLPELLQSSNNNTSSSQVWSKLPDMPYSSISINHYQGHLITFTGGRMVELPDEDKPVMKLVPLIHIYNPDTKTWDCVGDTPHGYYLCRSVHIRENKILFIGGVTGRHNPNIDDDIMTTCSILTLTPQ